MGRKPQQSVQAKKKPTFRHFYPTSVKSMVQSLFCMKWLLILDVVNKLQLKYLGDIQYSNYKLLHLRRL